MSNYRTIGQKIPDDIRSLRLMIPADPIKQAVALPGTKDMQLLFAIWVEFIQPGVEQDIDCPKCVARILSNFREMKDELITLEKEYQLLNSLG